ncbi:MAG: tetratricopeptide repeat protein [Ignavibacteriae bacterium]|nr:tetratricopeptide repeat protein [Ignavibacteriota bacterium]MCB9216825.1 tetratricopeptide repeat protein [Ignavibacteria bacterium]
MNEETSLHASDSTSRKEDRVAEILSKATALCSTQDYSGAVALYTSLLEALPPSDETEVRVLALHSLGDLYADLGDTTTALEYYLDSLVEAEERGDYSAVGIVLHSIGVLYGNEGNYEEAREYLKRSCALFRETGSERMEVRAMRNLGEIYLSEGNLTDARECELRAMTAYDLLDDPVNAAAAMISIGGIHEQQAEPDIALSYYLRASESLERGEEYTLFAAALLGTGRSYYRMGQLDSARFSLEQGLAIAEEIADRRLQSQYHDTLSHVFKSLDNPRAALDHARHYITLHDSLLNQERQKMIAELQMRFNLERQLKEEELRRQHDVTRAMMQTQEAERLRIAGDLHDGVGQLLAAIRLNMLRVDRALRGINFDQKALWERSLQLLQRASSDVRTISHSLSSSTLRELGLVAAIREIVVDMHNTGSLRFRFEPNGIDENLPEEVTLGLFRIAQELILNVVRHAKATSASVHLVQHDNMIVLMVEDNGVGFDTGKKREGMGTRNIEARVRAMKGTLHFDSQPGHGTTVTVEVATH